MEVKGRIENRGGAISDIWRSRDGLRIEGRVSLSLFGGLKGEDWGPGGGERVRD